MTSDSSSLPAPPIFAGGNFHLRAAKMMTYLRAQSLWDVVENESNPPPLAQMRNHNDKGRKSTFHYTVSTAR